MDKVLVLADLHVTGLGETIAGLDTLARTRAALAHGLSHHPDAAAVVLLGDLADHGDEAEYRRLRPLIEGLAVPVLPCLGNHDRREAFLGVFPEAPVTASGHVQAVLDLGRHRIVTLDTLDGPPYDEARDAGRLCAARRDWLEAALAGAEGRPVTVFAHHPAVAVGMPAMDTIRLADGPWLLDRLAAHPGAHLVSGHLHRTVSGVARGVGFTVLTSVAHQLALDLTTPGFTPALALPGSYGVLLLGPEGAMVHVERVPEDEG